MHRLPYLLGATALTLAITTVSCTTLGTHVKGGFACKAPQGTCAPMSLIDAEAIAGLGANGGDTVPVSGRETGGNARFITTGLQGGTPVRTGEHVMRVVFPAHTDRGGVFHEEAVAHLVTDRSVWAFQPAEAPVAGSLDAAISAGAPSSEPHLTPVPVADVQPTTSPVPINLREAAAGLSAPAVQMPEHVDERVAVDLPEGTPGAPTAAAIAAARAGHRIGDPAADGSAVSRPHQAQVHGTHHVHSTGQVTATIPGAETALLNRAVLQRLTAARDGRADHAAHQLAAVTPAKVETPQ